jgi:hypothetical protein
LFLQWAAQTLKLSRKARNYRKQAAAGKRIVHNSIILQAFPLADRGVAFYAKEAASGMASERGKILMIL